MTYRVKVFALFALGALFSACATSRLHREGLADTARGDYEAGIAKLEQAAMQDPSNVSIRIDLKSQRERAVQLLIAEADTARATGNHDAAERGYNRVLTIEERNGRALRGLEAVQADRRHAAMTAQAERQFAQGEFEAAKALLRSVLAENPGAVTAQSLLTRIDQTQGPINVTPRLRATGDQPVTLQFRAAPTDQVFEALSRQTGINFIFDRDVRGDTRTTIFVQRIAIEQAIDLILGQNQLARQILSENMVLIYPNTPAKQAEYQDQVVRTLYVTNTDPQQFSEVLRTMLNVRTVFVDARANAVVVRDTPEIVRMSEHLLASLDLPDAEVMLEVEILEITRTRLQQLGIAYPPSYTINPTPLAGEPLVLEDLTSQDRTTLTVTPVPITIDLRKEVGVSNVLASPRIRARNREQANILIGQRVPVITNTVTPTSSGAAVVTGSVQYVDVGLTLEVEPTIYLDGEVAIQVHLEVSNIIREIFNTTSGTLAYQIGTRNASTLLRLKDGETQVLAGLIQDIDRESSNRIPGLGDMPILGRLFGSQKDDNEETEIILSITPRIIRAQPRPSSENIEFWFGTEANARSAGSLGGAAAALRQVSSTQAATTLTARQAAAEESAVADDATPPPPRLNLTWGGPGQVAVGQEFEVTLELESATTLTALRAQLRYDTAALEIVSAEAGDLVPAGAGALTVEDRAARVRFDVENVAIVGAGSIIRLQFRALAPRPVTMVTVQQFAASGEDGLAVPVLAPRPFNLVVMP